MNRVTSNLYSCGFWLRLFALLAILIIFYIWQSKNAPKQVFLLWALFYHAVGGYSLYIAISLVTLFLEPPNEIGLRLFGLYGGCLFTVVGVMGCKDCWVDDCYSGLPLEIALLTLLVGVFLFTDVLCLECSRTMERIEPLYSDKDS